MTDENKVVIADFIDVNRKYSDVLGSPLAEALWELLNKPENLIRMETAIYLNRPPLEAVQLQIVEVFKCEDAKKIARYKQLMGSMARQIMSEQGFKPDIKKVKVRAEVRENETFFSTATRYIKN